MAAPPQAGTFFAEVQVTKPTGAALEAYNNQSTVTFIESAPLVVTVCNWDSIPDSDTAHYH